MSAEKPVKKHWYLLSFQIQHPGAWIPTSFVHGFDNMRITIPELNIAKQLNQVGNNSVVLAVCYLGYASEREMNGMPEIDPPSHTSESFRAGMAAAMAVPPTDSFQPTNPYVVTDDPHSQYAAAEWLAGFNLYRETEKVNVKNQVAVVGDKPTELEPPRKPTK